MKSLLKTLCDLKTERQAPELLGHEPLSAWNCEQLTLTLLTMLHGAVVNLPPSRFHSYCPCKSMDSSGQYPGHHGFKWNILEYELKYKSNENKYFTTVFINQCDWRSALWWEQNERQFAGCKTVSKSDLYRKVKRGEKLHIYLIYLSGKRQERHHAWTDLLMSSLTYQVVKWCQEF